MILAIKTFFQRNKSLDISSNSYQTNERFNISLVRSKREKKAANLTTFFLDIFKLIKILKFSLYKVESKFGVYDQYSSIKF